MAFRSRRCERKPKEYIDGVVIFSILCKWKMSNITGGSMRRFFPVTGVMWIGKVKNIG